MRSTRLTDITLGDMANGLGRYRPYVVVVIGVLLLAVASPGKNQSPGESRIAANQPDVATPRGEGLAPAVSAPAVVPTEGPVVANAPLQAGGTKSVAAPAARARAAAPAVAAQTTGAATSAPDCDPTTGRIKIPSFYAPNCVPLWAKGADNGGATYQGVTKDTLTIAFYVSQSNEQTQAIVQAAGYTAPDEQEADDNRLKVLEAYQAHFETYGRRVKLVKVKGSGPVGDDTAAKADAIRVATEIKAFASLNGPGSAAGGSMAYVQELAARGVVCIGCSVTHPQENYARLAPYHWGLLWGSYDQHVAIVVEYLAKRVWNRKAKFAGDPVMQQQTRKLGFVAYDTPDGAYKKGIELGQKEMARYGAKFDAVIAYAFDLAKAQEDSRVIIAKLKDAGITSVCLGTDPLYPIFITKEATNQQYFPEWNICAGALTDWAFFGRTYDQVQWQHAFGMGPLPARVNPDVEKAEGNLVTWHCGCTLSSYPHSLEMNQLFTGLHLAGPKLAPLTFRDGMFAYKPTVGYLTRVAVSYGRAMWAFDDYNGVDDMTELWWDGQAQGPDEVGSAGVGLYRYVDMGRRYLPGQIAAQETKAFDPANTVTIYDERPQADRFPVYEHKHYRGT